MFDYTPEQCQVLDGLAHWYGRNYYASMRIAEQRKLLRARDLRYDHHLFSESMGLRARCENALVTLIKVGWGLGLKTHTMARAMSFTHPWSKLAKGTFGTRFSDQAALELEGHNWSTSESRQALQKLVERHPWAPDAKNRPYQDRYMALQKIKAVRKKQLDYRASKNSSRCRTPYDTEVKETVGEVYEQFARTPLPLRGEDLRRAYGSKSPTTINKILEWYIDERGGKNT